MTRAEKAGCPAVAVTVDRNGGRNQETLFRLRRTDTRDCNACHDRRASSQHRAQADVRGRRYHRPYQHAVLRHDLGLHQAAARRDQDEDRAEGHPRPRGRRARREAGIDGIIVSNHGARSEDSGRSTIDALPEIVEAVKGRMPILVDSGFRRGTDIVKALCMGATGVCVGRPYVWGLGAFGQPGVERVLELLRIELRAIMQQVGAPNIKALVPNMVRRA